MKDWLGVFNGNKRLLIFGFLFSFFSSFGQTFFISLFVPYWLQLFGMTNSGFGTLYAVVTIAGAIFISFSGKYIDNIPLRDYALFVFTGLIISVLLLSQTSGVFILATGLLLVRWLGQGLMSHTSSTGIAKYFEHHRGKALSFSALGHPAGHFLFPVIMIPLITLAGWRNSLVIISVIGAAIMIPVIFSLKKIAIPVPVSASDDQHHKPDKRYKDVNNFLSLDFWIIALNIFSIPFICTAIFLYQYSIGEAKGWSASWVAFSFSFFAIFSAIGLVVSGSLTDRFTGLFLFPLYLIPAITGVLLMAISDSQYVFPVFYALVGISSGLGSTIKTAMQTELYGTDNLGKVRSYFSTILVISTALGPPVYGWFIDRNVTLQTIMLFTALFIILTAILSFRLWPVAYFKKVRVYAMAPLRFSRKQ